MPNALQATRKAGFVETPTAAEWQASLSCRYWKTTIYPKLQTLSAV